MLPVNLTKLLCTLLLGVAMLAAPAARADAVRDVQQVILRHIQAGEYDAAIAAAEAFQPGHPNHVARVAFVRGLVAKARGEMRTAAAEFRQVLVIHPEQIEARQQLAHVLFLSGENEAALHHFEVLEASAADPRQRDLYARYRNAIAERKPWSLSGYVTIAPSTNINKGTNNDTIDFAGVTATVNPASKAQSGLGVAAGLYGSYTADIAGGWSLVTSGAADGRVYSEHAADAFRLSLSTKPTWTSESGKLRIGAGPTADVTFLDYDMSGWRGGMAADISWALDQSLLFSGTVSALYQNYSGKDSDGMSYAADVQLVKSFGPSLAAGINAGVSIQDVEKETKDHTSLEAGLFVAKEWGGGWMTRVAPSVTHRKYDGILPLVPEAREDWAYVLSAQLSNRSLSAFGFMPVLNYSFTRQTSNDDFEDFDSHDVALTLTRSF